MSITFNFNGIPVTANSVSEAAELLRKLTEKPAPANQVKLVSPLSVAPPKAAPAQSNNSNDLAKTVAMLTVISEQQQSDSEDIMAALGGGNLKGLGAKVRPIKRILQNKGFEPDEVFLWERTPQGPSWNAGPRIEEALQALKGV